jgi:hypothetical protein
MNKKIVGLILVTGLMLPVAASAYPGGVSPASPAWEFSSINQTNNGGSTYGFTFGEIFTPTQNITVDYLGYFYDSSAGMADSHPVAIYDASGNLLASATITAASSSDAQGNFKFNYITPFTLIAGDTYVIDGASGEDDPWAWDVLGFTVSAPITSLGDNYLGFTGSYGLTAVDTGITPINDVNNGYFGADFGYEEPPSSTTPEPSSFLLLGSGLAGLAGLLKRKLMA